MSRIHPRETGMQHFRSRLSTLLGLQVTEAGPTLSFAPSRENTNTLRTRWIGSP